MAESIMQLQCQCNNYPWGKRGSKSLAARLCASTPNTSFKIDEDKDYSEMWLGTYPELPATVLSTGEKLQDVIDKNKEQLIGKPVLDRFGHSDLVFLPKVLSIAKALPLQLHPNKELSSKLHKEDPKNFTDPNHKPEIAVALGDFEAFVGFKPLAEIEKLLTSIEPLKKFHKTQGSGQFDDKALKSVVLAMLTASEETVKSTGEALRKVDPSTYGKGNEYIPKMLPRLWEQYDKTDPGTLVALVTMNYLQLQAGQSIYIPADGIHAYLSGDIIECMARSNNVLNTGFCPAADRNSAELFCSVLTFTPHTANDAMLPAKNYKGSGSGKTKVFAPPMSEFNMLTTELGSGEKETIRALGGPAVAINVKGKGTLKDGKTGKEVKVDEGYIFFIGQGTEMVFEAETGLQVYTAYVEGE